MERLPHQDFAAKVFGPDELLACSRIIEWIAEAFWNVPTANLASSFPQSDVELVADLAGEQLQSSAKVSSLMQEFAQASSEVLSDARVEYTALFCSSVPDAPFPYESVYSTEERLLMRPSRDDVMDAYEEAGYAPEQGDGFEPEDHLSIELRYLSALLEAEAACQLGQKASLEIDGKRASEIKKRFAESHLKSWIPQFANEVRQRAGLSMYPALADFAIEMVDFVA